MAEITGVTEVISSALSELSVAGRVVVKMDGEKALALLDSPADEVVEVTVVVKRASAEDASCDIDEGT